MYRILTEDVNRETIYSILDSYVDGYTIQAGTGSWRGVRENSIAIDLIGIDQTIAEQIALNIKDANKQESVLLLSIETEATFL
jgi:hypothetical protein